MLLHLLPIFMTPFLRTFIVKSNANNGRNLPSSPFFGLMTAFPVIGFINEKARTCIKEKAIRATNETTIDTFIYQKIQLF